MRAFVLGASILAGLALTSATQQLIRVDVSLGDVSINKVPQLVAADQGICAKYGLDVHQTISAGAARAAAASGVVVPDAYVNRDAGASAPIEVGGGSPMIYGSVVNGRPARVIVLTQEPMMMDHVIARPGIGGIQDLKGKRIGYSGAGAVTHFGALSLARQLGWTIDRDVTLVGGSATLDALKQDKVDAILTSAMVIARAPHAGFTDIGDLTAYKIPMAGSGIMVDKSYLAEHRDTVLRFLKADIEATALMQKDARVFNAALSKWFNITDAETQAGMFAFVNKFEKKPYPSVEGVTQVMTVYDSPEMRKHSPTDFYDSSLIAELEKSGFLDNPNPNPQNRQAPGKSIGTISTDGDLIVFTLDENALGHANLFDLVKHTLRFKPDAGGYRIEHPAFAWDADFGTQAQPRTPVPLHHFTFPFSGNKWDAFNVETTGAIGFGGGVTIGRFDQLQNAAKALVGKTPAICAFMKPRMSGPHYVKELADRVVITWTLTEPVGGIQDFTWTPTVNRFQVVLSKDGTIQMSYDEVAAKDAIVGVYQTVPEEIDSAKVAAVDLSETKKSDGPFSVVYESFHYLSLPNPRDLTCTVLNALGDKFDFLAYYADFRVDNQEAGTPSNGPLGGGPNGGAVTGIGAEQKNLASYCTAARFQWQFIQPVYVGANQMQERPPAGTTDANNHNIGFYMHQLGERTPEGSIPAYDYAVSQIGHEMGHRWSAFVSARVNGETIPLGPTHWARGLHAPAPFPFQRPTEASAMGGGVWQDNFDGTFTQLDDDYYVPATGYSYLDLYLMGLIAPSEVPDFFILRNLTPAGRDANGHPTFKADRTKITIQDVIAVEGPRQPDVDHAQKQFNTGIVVMVEHGRTPSGELIDRARGIRSAWIDYFATVTGHRASMAATVR